MSRPRLLCDWAANRGNPKGRLVMLAFRLASLVAGWPVPARWAGLPYVVVYRLVVEWVLGIELPWKLRVGAGLRLYHGQSLVVNDRAVIGRDCVLRHCTTIGVSTTDLDFGGEAPVIGDGVDIGSNVVIVGAIRVGDGARIGAGSVVIADVPAGGVAVGNPARLVTPRAAPPAVEARP